MHRIASNERRWVPGRRDAPPGDGPVDAPKARQMFVQPQRPGAHDSSGVGSLLAPTIALAGARNTHAPMAGHHQARRPGSPAHGAPGRPAVASGSAHEEQWFNDQRADEAAAASADAADASRFWFRRGGGDRGLMVAEDIARALRRSALVLLGEPPDRPTPTAAAAAALLSAVAEVGELELPPAARTLRQQDAVATDRNGTVATALLAVVLGGVSMDKQPALEAFNAGQCSVAGAVEREPGLAPYALLLGAAQRRGVRVLAGGLTAELARASARAAGTPASASAAAAAGRRVGVLRAPQAERPEFYRGDDAHFALCSGGGADGQAPPAEAAGRRRAFAPHACACHVMAERALLALAGGAKRVLLLAPNAHVDYGVGVARCARGLQQAAGVFGGVCVVACRSREQLEAGGGEDWRGHDLADVVVGYAAEPALPEGVSLPPVERLYAAHGEDFFARDTSGQRGQLPGRVWSTHTKYG